MSMLKFLDIMFYALAFLGGMYTERLLIAWVREKNKKEKKEWQGLSDEEISKLIKENVAIDCTCDPNGFIEAIEQKLKEKNHGTT